MRFGLEAVLPATVNTCDAAHALRLMSQVDAAIASVFRRGVALRDGMTQAADWHSCLA